MMFAPFSKTNEEYQLQIECVYNRLQKYLKWTDSKILLWMQTKNPFLGDLEPIDMIKIGRFERLLEWVNHQIALNSHTHNQQSPETPQE